MNVSHPLPLLDPTGDPAPTWAMNAHVPAPVADTGIERARPGRRWRAPPR
jgi:hypothetical protein